MTYKSGASAHNLGRKPHNQTSTLWCGKCRAEGTMHPEPDPITSDPEFIEFAQHVQADLIPKIQSSAVSLMIQQPDVAIDVKYAVELGCCILLDKPIIVVALPGAPVPDALRKVAHSVVEGDPQTPDGSQALQEAITAVMGSLMKQEREEP
jgi:hypothetical protein